PGGQRHASRPRPAQSRAAQGRPAQGRPAQSRPAQPSGSVDEGKIAEAISRQLSAALDEAAVMGEFPYTLEVSSPGVDRPLTDPRHWRRAVGRLVKVTVADSGVITGRIVSADPDGVTLD